MPLLVQRAKASWDARKQPIRGQLLSCLAQLLNDVSDSRFAAAAAVAAVKWGEEAAGTSTVGRHAVLPLLTTSIGKHCSVQRVSQLNYLNTIQEVIDALKSKRDRNSYQIQLSELQLGLSLQTIQ